MLFLGCPNPVPPDPTPTILEGSWSGTSEAYTGTVVFKFENNTVVASVDTCGGGSPCVQELYRGTFSLDTLAEPDQIDIVIKQSDISKYKGKTIRSLFILNANVLILSADEPGADRPTEMTNILSLFLDE
jgi:uncharacterized protein (TIGR03067 family)